MFEMLKIETHDRSQKQKKKKQLEAGIPHPCTKSEPDLHI